MSDKPEDNTEDTTGFDEAVAMLAAKDNPEAETVETKPEAEAEAKAEAKETAETEAEDTEAEDTETEEESAPDLWAGVTEEQRLELDRLQQRERSAAGRVSSTQREINRLKQELAAMQAPAQTKEPAAETPAADTAPKPAATRQQSEADPEREAAEFKLQMFEQRPDWADIASKPEFQEWVSKQKPYIQAKVQVNDVDGALAVLDLWDVSQQQNERARKAQSVQDKRAERLKSTTETRGKSSPLPTDSNVDDGLEGWAAGVKRCEQERRERYKYG